MKNPNITAKLNDMMTQEIALTNLDKKLLVASIISHERENQLLKSIEDEFNRICDLMSYAIGDLQAILGDITSDLWSDICHKFNCNPDSL